MNTGGDDHALAARLAHECGQRLLDLLSDPAAPQGWGLEDSGDRLAHEFLTQELARLRPGDAVLSEEGRDDRRRLDADRVWILDPLDGSYDFGVTGAWSVHVALCERGVPAAAAVAVPAWGTTFATDPPPEPTMCRVGRRRIVVARSRGYSDGRRLADRLDAEVVTMGSAGVKAMAVVRGEMDAYVHAGGLYEWDTCAPAAVALAAGLHASCVDGSPLRFNNPRPHTPGLVICRPDFADELLGALAPVA
ncbi:MAG: 3'(2'),5'-bisphosphate nucleotidase CysQ [Acidimicrobiaceae bacterium]|nr:3'(2'),5'-bisphosphate nucleotidase CysQ [Acidimicrobiaceae bacterium]MYF41826.1 3'(2'),5'-bisphosphate nucleotidase CysQ [Acidimicrobiaceae bacterium]MYJ36700.1 3'(2'),5'-bisphosphate nucleotidase CysQ [Acidimicrobiaceae bacterium]